MRIAICHYHLQRGGVTRIILHTVRALERQGARVVVLAGEAPPDSWSMPHRVVPELHYDNICGGCSADTLYDHLLEAANLALGATPDVWHFHNHSLGKNLALPLVISRLAQEGRRLLLHIHDFPEDGRPNNYSRLLNELAAGDHRRLSRILYPSAPHVHYVLLNGRDLDFIRDAGASEKSVHLMPNPVEVGGGREMVDMISEGEISKERLYLYPTRAIRRKNIGEFLLWAVMAPSARDTFALTMAPSNPAERPFYQGWKRLSAELCLPVQFEYAEATGYSFDMMLQKAHAVMTTSVAEGFGMAFLEPWLMGRAVCGRDLPEITGEFRDSGIRLPYMYSRLDVPVSMLGRDELVETLIVVQDEYHNAYGLNRLKLSVPSLADTWIQDEMIDFARLDEPFQAKVIRRLSEQPEMSEELACENNPLKKGYDQELISSNRNVICSKYSLENYSEKIMDVYLKISESEPGTIHNLDGIKLLERFLAPERLSLLRM